MYRWIPYAFVRITLLYCAGVASGICFGKYIDTTGNIVVCLISAAAFMVCVLLKRGRALLTGMLAAVALLSAGTLNVLLTNESRDDAHVIHIKDKITSFEAVVQTAAQERSRSWKYEVSVQRVRVNGVWRRAMSRALLYVQKDSLAVRYQFGDRLFIDGALVRIPAPLNPHEFNFQAYQANRQVYCQSNVEANRIYHLASGPADKVMGTAINARLWAEGVITKHVEGTRARAIASAFVLGVTDGLDTDLMTAYASTGAMHVLSVSGLHVGIVYWLLLMLFKPFDKRITRWPLLVVSLVVLWSYALVTGISASVLRAVVMFSFASVARACNYKMNIYNILAATVCVLLTIDPYMITFVGFQLSFVAVLGIVAIQPALYQLWEPTGWLCDEIWKLISVSIAAQIATLPLCLLYFHQFPNYFLIANLFIVPGSFVVLLMGIALLATSALEPVAQIIGHLLELLIDFLNQLIFLVEKLPGSVVDNIFITPFQCLIMALIVGMAVIWIESRSRRVLAGLLGLIAFFSIASWAYSVNTQSPRITVYATKGFTAVDMIAGHMTSYFGAPETIDDSRRLTPNRIARRAADSVVIPDARTIFPGCDIYVWQGLDIVRIYAPVPNLFEGRKADLVIVSNNAVKDLRQTARLFTAPRFVIDGSNNLKTTDELLKQAAGLPLQIHSVLQHGALELTF